MSRTGDWICTASGIKWYITDPDPADVRIEDIAHALSNICRFGGHCRTFYCVAEHSFRMALIHDAAEAYLGDMVRPLKMTIGDYRYLETMTERVIISGLGFKPVCDACRAYVKHLDDVLLMTERRDLVNHRGHEWTPRATPLPQAIVPMPSELARMRFMELYLNLLEDGGMQ